MSKKATKSQKEQFSYEYRDIVLAKIRGYPPWPGMVVDPDSVPTKVLKERPGLKKPFYCIKFFPAGDYAWLVPKDISKLQTHEIEAYLNAPFRKSGDLINGYRIALDPKTWEEELEEAHLQDSSVEENAEAEVDQLASEDEGGEDGKKSKPKKRKRDAESGASSTKAKAKNKSKKESVDLSAKKKSGKGRRNGNKSKDLVESEDDGDHAGDGDGNIGPSKHSSPPPTKKAKRDKDEDEDPVLSKDPEAIKVRDWRHKLQKTFLSNKGLPKEDDMPALDSLFTTVETYEEMSIQYLSFSKIGKVMRHIAALAPEKVPKDAEYKFRERAKVLVDKWHQILSVNKLIPDAGTNGTKVDGDHEAVTEGTANIDLNGNANAHPVALKNDPNVGDLIIGETTLGDITMSEA